MRTNNNKELQQIAKILLIATLVFGLISSNAVSQSLTLAAENPGAIGITPKPEAHGAAQLSVDNSLSTQLLTGAATTAYTIEVPPGVNGMQPAIALSYNHFNARSIPARLGQGWSLNRAAIYRDVNFTPADTSDDFYRIQFNGINDKLVNVNGIYHTERETFLRIEQIDSDNDHGMSWKVTSKDGTTYRFGVSQEAEVVSNLYPFVVSWNLESATDIHGNTISYHYTDNIQGDIGTAALHSITYGESEINFQYIHAANPTPLRYVQGTSTKTNTLLDKIVILHNGQLVRTYYLIYKHENRKSYLDHIKLIGTEGNALSPTRYSYDSVRYGHSQSDQWKLPSGVEISRFDNGNQLDMGTRLVDINGDSLVDIVQAPKGIKKAYYNTGQGFAPAITLPEFFSSGITDEHGADQGVRFLDVNGDGKLDVVQALVGTTTNKAYLENVGDHWISAAYPLPNEVTFIEPEIIEYCEPDSYVGGSCGGSWCAGTKCYRDCQIDSCSDEGTIVYEHTGEPSWNDDGDNDEYDRTPHYTPNQDKCYSFSFTGSTHDDGSDSTCYDLETEADFDEGNEDCNENDLKAYGVIGFTTLSSNSWLETVWTDPNDPENFGWQDDLTNNGLDDTYIYTYGKDSSPDSSGSDIGEWDGLSDDICAEAGEHTIYCAPSHSSCDEWGKNKCGYDCQGERTRAYVSLGVYVDYYRDLSDAAYDLEPACESDVMEDNDYKGSGAKYVVKEYNIEQKAERFSCDSPIRYRDSGTRLVDLNADGFTDIIKSSSTGRNVWINNKGTFEETDKWTPPTSVLFADVDGVATGTKLIDVNGDSLPDIVHAHKGTHKTFLNTGNSWIESSTWKIPAEASFKGGQHDEATAMADVNLDGLPDILHKASYVTDRWYYQNTGAGWVKETWFPSFSGGFNYLGTRIVDINGDQINDIVIATDVSTQRKTHLGLFSRSHLLTEITNELGGTTSIGYSGFYRSDNTGDDDISDLSLSGTYVSSVSVKNGRGSNAITRYDYEGGLYDTDSREFRGFAIVAVTHPDQHKTIHHFHQDDARKGLEYKTETYDIERPLGSHKLLSIQNDEFSSAETNGIRTIELQESTTSIYDGLTDPLVSKTTYEYDAYSNPTRVTHHGFDDPEDDRIQISTYENDEENWLLGIIIATELQDSEENKISRTEYHYDYAAHASSLSKGLLTKVTRWNDHGSDISTHYTYDDFGNQLTEKDPNGNIWTQSYDESNRFVIRATNPLGHELSTTYDPGTGNVLSETDANDLTTHYEYDEFNRIHKIIDPLTSSDKPATEIAYNTGNPANNYILIRERINENDIIESADFYDGLGQLIQSRRFHDEAPFVFKDYRYDSMGNVWRESVPYLGSNNAAPILDSKQPRTVYEYDGAGRITTINYPDGTQRKFEYTQNIISAFDQNSHQTDQITDAFGQIATIVEYNDDDTYATNYFYDPAGNLVQIYDDLRNTVTFEYDSLGREIRTDDSDIGIVTYTYDANGNVVEQQHGEFAPIITTYDELDRPLAQSAGSSTVTYLYDRDKLGKVSKITTDIGSKEFAYDERYRVIEKKETYDEIEFITTYEYDLLDRITSTTRPDNREVAYTYNNQGLVRSVGNIVSNIVYNAYGTPISRTYGNSVETVIETDQALGRITSIVTGSDQILQYEYDNAGNIAEINDKGMLLTLTYDNLDRLIRAKRTIDGLTTLSEGIFDIQYEYNSIGNILSVTNGDEITTYKYSEPVHAASLMATLSTDNTGPSILQVLPDTSVTVNEGTTELFSFTAVDSEGDTLYPQWRLNGELVSESIDYEYTAGYDDAGEHEIIVFVTDGQYDDHVTIELTVIEAGECNTGETRPCSLQQGVCSGSVETCTDGSWPGCAAANYGSSYQSSESICDNLDNDCDGSVDEGNICAPPSPPPAPAPPPPAPAPPPSCIDRDFDGYGAYCALGPDCNDNNKELHNNCNQCGNNVIEGIEQCDEGANNGVESSLTCYDADDRAFEQPHTFCNDDCTRNVAICPEPDDIAECSDEHFTCTDWGDCQSHGYKYRSCIGTSICNGDYQPRERIDCTYESPSSTDPTVPGVPPGYTPGGEVDDTVDDFFPGTCSYPLCGQSDGAGGTCATSSIGVGLQPPPSSVHAGEEYSATDVCGITHTARGSAAYQYCDGNYIKEKYGSRGTVREIKYCYTGCNAETVSCNEECKERYECWDGYVYALLPDCTWVYDEATC